MKKTILGIVGLLLGGLAGMTLGGPLVIVVTAGLAGLGGYYAGSLLQPAKTRRG